MNVPMLAFAKIYFLAFGLVTLASGLSGYLKAGSRASLIAGAVLGALLLVASFLLPGQWKVGHGLALLACVAILGKFLPAVLKGAYNPGGYLVPLAVIGAVAAIVGFFGSPAN